MSGTMTTTSPRCQDSILISMLVPLLQSLQGLFCTGRVREFSPEIPFGRENVSIVPPIFPPRDARKTYFHLKNYRSHPITFKNCRDCYIYGLLRSAPLNVRAAHWPMISCVRINGGIRGCSA